MKRMQTEQHSFMLITKNIIINIILITILQFSHYSCMKSMMTPNGKTFSMNYLCLWKKEVRIITTFKEFLLIYAVFLWFISSVIRSSFIYVRFCCFFFFGVLLYVHINSGSFGFIMIWYIKQIWQINSKNLCVCVYLWY